MTANIDVETVRLVTREFMQDPYPVMAAVRDNGAAIPIDSSGMRMWVVTRYADAQRLLADPNILKDMVANGEAILRASVLRPEKLRGVPLALRRHMLDRDEPDHTRLRSLVSSHFTGTAVQTLQMETAATAEALLDALPEGQPIDLIDGFCRPLARAVVSRLMGIRLDDPTPFPVWVNDLLTAPDKSVLNGSAAALVAFIAALLNDKMIHPGDDIATDLARAASEGTLTRDESIASVHILLTGGLEPMNGIANAVCSLLLNPDQLAALRADPSLTASCVEEALRYESPFRMLTPRYSRTPIDIGGVVIPAFEMILICVAAAGRDPERFEDPDRFDLSRIGPSNLAFGRGVHRCLGAHLGRLVMETALSMLMARWPEISLADTGAPLMWQPGIFMRRLLTLPVVLSAEGRRT